MAGFQLFLVLLVFGFFLIKGEPQALLHTEQNERYISVQSKLTSKAKPKNNHQESYGHAEKDRKRNGQVKEKGKNLNLKWPVRRKEKNYSRSSAPSWALFIWVL